jgi:hypothetical protein
MWLEELDQPMKVPLPRVHQDGTWTVSLQRVWLAHGLIPRMILYPFQKEMHDAYVLYAGPTYSSIQIVLENDYDGEA